MPGNGGIWTRWYLRSKVAVISFSYKIDLSNISIVWQKKSACLLDISS